MRSTIIMAAIFILAGCKVQQIGVANPELLFQATGREPTWLLRIDGPQLLWVTNYGIDTFRIKLEDHNLYHRKDFDSISDRDEDLHIGIRPGGCKVGRDTGSHSVVIHYNSRDYSGCGQWVKKN